MKLKDGVLKLHRHDLDHILSPVEDNDNKEPLSYYLWIGLTTETRVLNGYKDKDIDKIEIDMSEFDIYKKGDNNV